MLRAVVSQASSRPEADQAASTRPARLEGAPKSPADSGGPPSVSPGRVPREIANFIDHIRGERGLAANTCLAYRRDLMRFAAYIQQQGRSWGEIDRAGVRGYLADLFRHGLSARAVARHLES